jgi:GTP-binding protein YchF
MKLGVVGLPNVGKSTLFNAITKAGAMCANYPFCTIEPNVGIVPLKDKRLDALAQFYNSKKIVYTTLEFVDIAGLVKGASKGEGLGNKFLANIREVDAIVHVVRCFEDSQVTHVENTIDPIRDIEIINTELIYADLESLNRRLAKARVSLKGDKKYQADIDTIEKLIAALERGEPARNCALSEEERELVKDFFLLTSKKVIYCANVSDSTPSGNDYSAKVEEYARGDNGECVVVSAKIESELTELPDEEREAFLLELGIEQSGLDKLVESGFRALSLMTFLTAGEKEVKAWTIPVGTKAPQGAGKIHTDFEKGFIRAEVVPWDVLIECGSYALAKEKGKVRSEGKDYVFRDGDVVLFRFNV